MASTLLHIKSRMLLPYLQRGKKRRRRKIPEQSWSEGFWSIKDINRQRANWRKGIIGSGCFYSADADRVPGT